VRLAPVSGRSWGLPEALAGFGAGLLVSAFAASAVAHAVGYDTSSSAPMPVAVTAADLAGLWLGLVGAVMLATRMNGSGSVVRDYGLRVGAWWDIPLGAALGLACQYLLVPGLYLPFEHLDHHLAHQLSQPANKEAAAAHGWPAVAALLLLLAIGAPLVEELFFRGLLLRSLLGRLPAPAAVVISAVLFGLAHFEALQIAGLAAFGVILALLAWRTGRLAPGIAAHAAFNAAAVLTVVHPR
jgi:uncharacterized protein